MAGRRAPAAVLAAATVVGATWVSATLGARPVAAEQPATPTPTGCVAHVPWTELRFGASKFLLSATATMKVAQRPATQARGELRSAPEGEPLPLQAPCLTEITVTTRMPFGRGEKVAVWIDPGSGAAQQYEKVTSGGSPYHKIGRYTRDGYYLWRTSPADAHQSSLSPEEWTHRKSHYSSWGDKLPEGAVVTDPYALLYLVSEASRSHSVGKTRAYYIFADGHLVEVSFTVGATTITHVDFKEGWEGGGRKRSGQVQARTVRVSAAGVADGEHGGKVDLGFLGMRGALTILLDSDSGIPLAVKGDVEHLGELIARLEEVRLLGQPQH